MTGLLVMHYQEPGSILLRREEKQDISQEEAQKLAAEAIAKHETVQLTWRAKYDDKN